MLSRWVLGLLLLLVCPVFGQARVELAVQRGDQGAPLLEFRVPSDTARVILSRSTSDLSVYQDPERHPIVRYSLETESQSYEDYLAPQGVVLYYQVQALLSSGGSVKSGVVAVQTHAPQVFSLQNPYLMVDKESYTMYLMDGGTVARSFPIALGANPKNRKLYLDRASTPEGLYYITNRQPTAEFHRAFDINYPNEVDQERYALHEKLGLLPYPNPHIGGDIQIHGDGIEGNWTWGCIALRNPDMDWLFSLPELRRGVLVAIAGNDLSMDDLEAISYTTQTERSRILQTLRYLGIEDAGFHQAVGRFQYQSQLPITGQLDLKTRLLLRRVLEVGNR
jgi:hypothetical protein